MVEITEIKLVLLHAAEVIEGCSVPGCDAVAHPWGAEGRDGYVEACRNHAKDLIADQISFGSMPEVDRG